MLTLLFLRTAALRLSALGFVAFALSTSAHAQTANYYTTTSFVAINYEDRQAATATAPGFYRYDSSPTGLSTNVSGETTYSFGDGTGISLGAESDTIRLSGTGWASSLGYGFTDLKASVSATLENAYLDVRDPDNAPEIEGSKAPYYWISEASAGWTLTSRFTGFTVAGNSYSVKWIFGVDGAVNAVDAGSGFAYLGFSYGAVSDSFSTSSLVPQMWATTSTPVRWGDAVETNARFTASWQYNLIGDGEAIYDENGLAGYVAPSSLSGTVDYANTTKLQEIQVFDQNGNRFYDFTVDDGNGNTFYQGNANAVAAPEPGTLPLALSGLLILIPARCLRRRSQPSRY